jgi:hypothetical protein
MMVMSLSTAGIPRKTSQELHVTRSVVAKLHRNLSQEALNTVQNILAETPPASNISRLVHAFGGINKMKEDTVCIWTPRFLDETGSISRLTCEDMVDRKEKPLSAMWGVDTIRRIFFALHCTVQVKGHPLSARRVAMCFFQRVANPNDIAQGGYNTVSLLHQRQGSFEDFSRLLRGQVVEKPIQAVIGLHSVPLTLQISLASPSQLRTLPVLV